MREITVKLLFAEDNDSFDQAVKSIQQEVLWSHPWIPGATFRLADYIEVWADGEQLDPPETDTRAYVNVDLPEQVFMGVALGFVDADESEDEEDWLLSDEDLGIEPLVF